LKTIYSGSSARIARRQPSAEAMPDPYFGPRPPSKPLKLRVKELREARGLTKAGLARLAGVTPTAIGHYERGRVPRMDIRPRLAAALGVGVGDLDPPAAGSPLRRLREARGWTQAELARRAGVSRDAVLRVERGRAPVADTARKLAAALGSGAADLSLLAPPRPKVAGLREVRAARGLSQGELAARAGLGRPTVSRLERGHQAPTSRTLASLARALGVAPEELLGEAPSPGQAGRT
jgi:transcriptional regulator with XRE-family HTH domain